MEIKNKALAGMAMEDDALETVTGGLYGQEPPGLWSPGSELPPLEHLGLVLPPYELSDSAMDILDNHKKRYDTEKFIDD